MSPQSGELELSVSIADASFSASGETRVVLDAYADFKELIRAAPAATRPRIEASPAETAEAVTEPKPTGDQAAPEVKAPTSLPLKPYLERLKLPGNKHKAAAMVAWSAESGAKADLTVTEVEALWRRSPFKVPKNVPRDLRAAETEGWLESDGKEGSPGTTYRINGFGEGVVAGWIQAEE
jgi:hypothetical protein